MTVPAIHRARFERMVRDLGIDPGAVLVDRDMALWDVPGDRRLTPPLNNQTLAEGLASAVTIAALVLGDTRC